LVFINILLRKNINGVNIRLIMTKLKHYLTQNGIKNKMAAIQIGCSPEHLSRLANGLPGGRQIATKIQKWSRDKIKIADIMLPGDR